MTYTKLENNIVALDLEFLMHGLACCYIIEQNGKYALVETGPANSSSVILDYFQQNKISLKAIEYVFITHVHLDHAGGAGILMPLFPNAKLVVHPRGVRHMIDPSKLWNSALSVYGDKKLRAEFGEMIAVQKERIIEAEDESIFYLDNRALKVIHTRGHAKHHYCLWDEQSKGMFTGDSFGVSLRFFDTPKDSFITISASPVQFEPEEAHISIDKIMSYNPKYAYLTHCGCVTNLPKLAQQLHNHIDELVALALRCVPYKERICIIRDALINRYLQEIRRLHCLLDRESILNYLGTDIELNTQGLDCWLQQQEKK